MAPNKYRVAKRVVYKKDIQDLDRSVWLRSASALQKNDMLQFYGAKVGWIMQYNDHTVEMYESSPGILKKLASESSILYYTPDFFKEAKGPVLLTQPPASTTDGQQGDTSSSSSTASEIYRTPCSATFGRPDAFHDVRRRPWELSAESSPDMALFPPTPPEISLPTSPTQPEVSLPPRPTPPKLSLPPRPTPPDISLPASPTSLEIPLLASPTQPEVSLPPRPLPPKLSLPPCPVPQDISLPPLPTPPDIWLPESLTPLVSLVAPSRPLTRPAPPMPEFHLGTTFMSWEEPNQLIQTKSNKLAKLWKWFD